MKNEFLKNCNSLLDVILSIEKREQKRYYEAVGSESRESTKIMLDANAKIRKLRDIINSFKSFHFDVLEILGEDVTFVEKKPESEGSHSFTLFGEKHFANSKEEMVMQFCEAVILVKPHQFLGMGYESGPQAMKFAGFDGNTIEKPHIKLSNALYISIAGDTADICVKVLDKCGIDRKEFCLGFEEATK